VKSKDQQLLEEAYQLILEKQGKIIVYHATTFPKLKSFKPFSHFGTKQAALDRIKDLLHAFENPDDEMYQPKTLEQAVAKEAPRNLEKAFLYTIALDIKNPVRVLDYINVGDPIIGEWSDAEKISLWSLDILKNTTKTELVNILKWYGTWVKENVHYHIEQILESQFPFDNLLPEHLKWKLACGKDVSVRYTNYFKQWIYLMMKYGVDALVYENKLEDKGQDSYIIFDPKQVQQISKIPETIDLSNLPRKISA